MTLGKKIQELRRRSAMSQDVLAERLEVSRQAVSKWERDEAMPETDKIVRIAQLFSVSTDYLLTDAPEQAHESDYASVQRKPSAGERLERFVRRRGYKAGYVLIGVGIFLCLMALMIACLLPQFGKEFLGPFSSDWGNDYVGDFMNHHTGQAKQSMQNFLHVMTAFIGIPMAMAGVGMTVFGAIVVAKGKRIAAQTP